MLFPYSLLNQAKFGPDVAAGIARDLSQILSYALAMDRYAHVLAVLLRSPDTGISNDEGVRLALGALELYPKRANLLAALGYRQYRMGRLEGKPYSRCTICYRTRRSRHRVGTSPGLGRYVRMAGLRSGCSG